MELKQRIEQSKALSEKELDAIENDPASYDNVYAHLKNFIRYRFLIDDDDYWEDDIARLTAYSIEKTLEKIGSNDGLGDLSMNCAGASSAETKYVLLLITLRKRLGLTFEPVMAATLDTVPLLAEEITKQLTGSRTATIL